ncbi:MAG: EAL domain-containing protein [Candidatus Thiodiazotropha lotti]|uniref:putative bifunctional diguanylate cyclase/phosphodiesterase n=1 Tax=Candidatus Thiodiazotropha endoloripes TaxID=1818881 RepID=UPI00083D3662|nr:EAL domain-containing protein [Candidatus Thiodiazotropha endoloripes]MCG7904124.1 EAL domain-containing protein [Candidatus Thiodiazotropha weberae]MCG7993675.1 EAL domain-containing protein [Candidatus Thiodiazotropha lotti]MCG8000875.1 EAL domain-containing protein [Candidatus Thiodiazotropha lotti]MCW4185340.1 EAL domain-containing protein [Candidatus Thiodiazotropha weberae]MCW4192648.1 EAL domain-containing protein [Candidatus Thiodiazotropha weberae]
MKNGLNKRGSKPRWAKRFADKRQNKAKFSNNKNHSDPALANRIFSAFKDGILVTDAKLQIIDVNDSFSRVTGYSREEALGQKPQLLSSGRHGPDYYERMWQQLEQNGVWQGTIWNRRKNGEVYPEWLSIEALTDRRGDVTHYTAVFSDLSKHKDIHNQIHLMAYYDSLTGLPNRQLFSDRLDLSLSLARREKQKVALFFMDLDRFKDINDSLGHTTGDQLLNAVANRLTNSLRQSDTIARLGGDEFTVILSGIQDNEKALNVANKILDCFQQPFRVGRRDIHISTSIGISLYPEHSTDSEHLVRHADTAMYQAKEAGKNRFMLYTPQMGSQHKMRVTLENELRKALTENSLKLAYQPQIDLTSNKIITIEALARWNHPEIGAIPPNHFIPIAEKCGLINDLGSWVLHSACSQLAKWRQQIGIDLRIAVNVSGIQLLEGRLDSDVRLALNANKLPPSSLELEITESVLMLENHEALNVLSNIKQMGVLISIDDFGTGYSSLSYIKRFDIDKLKIDRSFICDVSSSDCDRQLVRTIINMGHDLSLKVTAEGIEDKLQLDFLQESGCDLAQGYYISPPVSSGELTQLLQEAQRRLQAQTTDETDCLDPI